MRGLCLTPGAEGGGGGSGSGECAACSHGNAAGPEPVGLPAPVGLRLRGSGRSPRRVGPAPCAEGSLGREALPDRLRAVFPRRPPASGAVAADVTALSRPGTPGPTTPAREPCARAGLGAAHSPGRPLSALPDPAVCGHGRAPAQRPGACAGTGASEPRSDSARPLVSGARGFGDRSPALRAPGGDGATWLSLAPLSSEKRLENEGLFLSLLFHDWQLSYSSLSTYTQHCIAQISPKCLSLALLGTSHAQLAAYWDRQGKHWLSPEQRLFGIIVCVCHKVFFLTPDPTLTCPLAVLIAWVRK